VINVQWIFFERLQETVREKTTCFWLSENSEPGFSQSKAQTLTPVNNIYSVCTGSDYLELPNFFTISYVHYSH
jgi:hypothetical protein